MFEVFEACESVINAAVKVSLFIVMLLGLFIILKKLDDMNY